MPLFHTTRMCDIFLKEERYLQSNYFEIDYGILSLTEKLLIKSELAISQGEFSKDIPSLKEVSFLKVL